MKKINTEEVCSACIHQLVNGVACDWKPCECPFVQREKKEKERQMKTHAFHGEIIAIPGETSFILSTN